MNAFRFSSFLFVRNSIKGVVTFGQPWFAGKTKQNHGNKNVCPQILHLNIDVHIPSMYLKSALFHMICPARFTSSLKFLFLPGPGLRAPLSSYLEVALYKFHRQIDR